MTLSMTRPKKHPDSGYYWFRKRVPDDIRNLIGKREERFSLGTRDPSEAKRLHALKLAEVEERWANLRVGQRPLSPTISRDLLRKLVISFEASSRSILTSRCDGISK
jgi:hypothetical protein